MPAFPDRPQTATEILQAQIDWIDNQRGKYLREELENCVSRAKGLQKELNSLEVQRKGLLKAAALLRQGLPATISQSAAQAAGHEIDPRP